MAILEELSAYPDGLTASQLVGQLNIEKSSVSQILGSLDDIGYVVRDHNNPDLFRLSIKYTAISLRYLDNSGLHDLCAPELRSLAEKTGELVQLVIKEGDQLTYVVKVDGPQRIQFRSLLGTAAVLHASTAAKVWLASLQEKQALGLVLAAGMPKLARNTITSIDRFRLELKRVREFGYATVEEELLDGGNAIGVPIRRKQSSEVVGAVIVTGPAFRFPRKRMIQFVDDLLKVATSLAEVWDFKAQSASASGLPTDSSLGHRQKLSRGICDALASHESIVGV